MDAQDVSAPVVGRKEEDYTGSICLLVRERDKRRHAKLEVLIDADRLADAAPLDWVIWRTKKRSRKKYIVCLSPMPGMKGWILSLHRFLTDPPEELVVDHKSRKTCDNRGQNLRPCTPSQNGYNRGGNSKHSKYKGVKRLPGRRPWGKWQAFVSIDGRRHYIGTFREERHAAYAYNVFAQESHGEFAYLNDVTLTPDEVRRADAVIEQMAAERARKAYWSRYADRHYEPPLSRGKPILFALDFLDDPELRGDV